MADFTELYMGPSESMRVSYQAEGYQKEIPNTAHWLFRYLRIRSLSFACSRHALNISLY